MVPTGSGPQHAHQRGLEGLVVVRGPAFHLGGLHAEAHRDAAVLEDHLVALEAVHGHHGVKRGRFGLFGHEWEGVGMGPTARRRGWMKVKESQPIRKPGACVLAQVAQAQNQAQLRPG